MAIPANVGTPTTTAKISDVNALITAINTELALYAAKASIDALTARVAALEAKPAPAIPPDLTDRVAALEATIAALRTPPAAASTIDPMASTIPHRARPASEGVELVYDKATLYYGDMELHALRIAENKWRLVAQLNYITINQIQWTYDETVEGTPEEIYAHATTRLEELAKLKVAHDAAHQRVREMSEGRP